MPPEKPEAVAVQFKRKPFIVAAAALLVVAVSTYGWVQYRQFSEEMRYTMALVRFVTTTEVFLTADGGRMSLLDDVSTGAARSEAEQMIREQWASDMAYSGMSTFGGPSESISSANDGRVVTFRTCQDNSGIAGGVASMPFAPAEEPFEVTYRLTRGDDGEYRVDSWSLGASGCSITEMGGGDGWTFGVTPIWCLGPFRHEGC